MRAEFTLLWVDLACYLTWRLSAKGQPMLRQLTPRRWKSCIVNIQQLVSPVNANMALHKSRGFFGGAGCNREMHVVEYAALILRARRMEERRRRTAFLDLRAGPGGRDETWHRSLSNTSSPGVGRNCASLYAGLIGRACNALHQF